MKPFYLALQVHPWESIEVGERPICEPGAVLGGAVGYSPIFDSYEAALESVDGRADLVCELKTRSAITVEKSQ